MFVYLSSDWSEMCHCYQFIFPTVGYSTEPCMICCIFLQSSYLFALYLCFQSLPVHTIMPLSCSLFKDCGPLFTSKPTVCVLFTFHITWSKNLQYPFRILPFLSPLFCSASNVRYQTDGQESCFAAHTTHFILFLVHGIILSVFFN